MAAAGRPGPHWWGTLLYVPLLYGLGWLLSRPLTWIFPGWRADQLDLAGVAIALLLLLASLPWRLRRLWGSRQPWQRLGVAMPPRQALLALGRGLLKAALLLLAIVLWLLASGQARWLGDLGLGALLNALALPPMGGSPEQMARVLRTDFDKLGRVVRDNKITGD